MYNDLCLRVRMASDGLSWLTKVEIEAESNCYSDTELKVQLAESMNILVMVSS